MGEIYIIECDSEWVECLKITFKHYKDKVHIVQRYISDDDLRLDEIFENKKVTFIKADIEGFEKTLLYGAKNVILKYHPSMVICVYHKVDDAEVIKNIIDEYGFNSRFSNGYMLFPIWDKENFKEPFVRKGLLYVNEK